MNKSFSWFCAIFIKPIVYLLFIKEVRGKKNIPKTNFILASNHQSHLDWFLDAFFCVPRRCRFIGQVDKYEGFIGFVRDFFYYITETIRLDRESKESKKEAAKEAIASLKKGYVLILYPEGTRSRTGEIGKGRWGTAKFFLETEVPVLPIGIEGTFRLLPPGGKLKIKRVIKINIGKPLYFEKELERAKQIDKNSEEYQQILIKITDRMMEQIASLKSQIS